MYVRNIVLIALVSLVFSIEGYGQVASDYRFKTLSFTEGLSNASVKSIVQDSLGYVWLGTENGLNRYDGTEVVVFKHNPDDTTSLLDNYIRKLFIDSQQRMWLVTTSGVCRYRPDSNNFEAYDFNASADYLHDSSPMDIVEDRTGRILVLSHYNKVFVFSERRKRFEKHLRLELNETARALCSLGDRLFVGTQRHLLEIDWPSGDVVYAKEIDESYDGWDPLSSGITQLTHVGDQLWITGSEIHLYRFDLSSQSLRKIDQLPYAAALTPLDARTLLVVSRKGVFWYNPSTDEKGAIQPSDPRLALRNAMSVLVDKDQNLWVARHRKGVAYTTGHRIFRDASHLNKNLIPYAGEISSVAVIDNQLWMGLNLSDVMVMNLEDYRCSLLSERSAEKTMLPGKGTVFSTFEDHRKQVWIGSYKGGLRRYDAGLANWVLSDAETDSLRIRGRDIRSIVEDQQGRLWLAVHGRGIDVYDPVRQRVVDSYGLSVGDTEPYIGDWTRQLATTSGGAVWIASASGLQVIDGPTKKYFQHHADQTGSLSNDHVTCLLPDRRGHLWIGTAEGLNLLNTQDSTFTHFTIQNGLNDNYIASIVEDATGDLWVGTYDGLARLSYSTDPRQARVQHVPIPPGQYSNQFIEQAGARDSVGNLYFATTHGLLSFHPDELSQQTEELSVFLSDFKVLSRSEEDSAVGLRPSDPLVRSILHRRPSDRIQLAPDQNTLSISFAAIDFVHSGPIRYYYQLQGYDSRWSESTDRSVVYYDLPAGTYQFLVKAASSGTLDSTPTRLLSISIDKPWYRTVGGRGLIALLIGSLMLLGIYILLERIRLKNQARLSEKEREVDQFKIKFFVNISHEFRTPLTLILGPLERLARLTQDHRGQQYVQLIQRNAQRLSRLVNQLLDLRYLEEKRYPLRVAEGRLSDLVRRVYDSFSYLAERHALDYQFNDHTDASTSQWFDADILDKVLFNLLSNAFKYTERGRINVTVMHHATRPGWTVIQVSDTGIGIQTEPLDKIFERFYRAEDASPQEGTGVGLSLCQELISLHQGQLTVESLPGQGSTFTVAIPTEVEAYDDRQMIRRMSDLSVRQLPRAVDRPDASFDLVRRAEDRPVVLVVDDNVDLLSFVEESVGHMFSVVTAQNGEEALRKAIALVPDAVVSDIMMPVMDGLALTQKLKEDLRTSHVPVLLLTARASDQHQVEGLAQAADDYVVKPFSVAILTAKLQSLIDNRAKLKELFAQGDPLRVQRRVRQSPEKAFLLKLTDIIEENVDNPAFGTDDVCEAIGMSKSQLYRKMSAVAGTSVHEFIKLHRLAKAAQLLVAGDDTVTEVSRATGFKYVQSFTRAFKDRYGCTPSQYVKRHTQKV